MANPWDKDKVVQPWMAGRVVASMPGTGKAPAGYGLPGAAAIVPLAGGPDDPDVILRNEQLKNRVTVGGQLAVQAHGAALARQADVFKSALEHQQKLADRNITAAPAGYRYKADGTLEPIPGGPIPAAGKNAAGGALDAIVGQVNDVSRQFAAGPGSTHGLASVSDYTPSLLSPANAALDAGAAGLEDQAALAFRVPGSGTVSDADAARIARANKPDRYSSDSANLQRFSQLRRRIDAARAAAGLPAAKWDASVPDPTKPFADEQRRIFSLASPATPQGDARGIGPASPSNSFTPSSGGGNTGDSVNVATGPTRRVADPGIAAAVADMVRAGRSTDEINSAFPGRTFPADQIDTVRQWLAAHPNYKGPLNVQAYHDEPTTAAQRIAASPLATGLASAADAAVPAGLISQDLKQKLRDGQAANPGAALAGTFAGGIPAAAGFELGAARLLPNGGAWVPRLADAAYGAYSGAGDANTGDRLQGGIIGGLAGGALGAAGRGVIRGVGTAARGVNLSDAVQLLRDRGIPLTVGQTLGGKAKGIEDRLGGLPVVGDVVRERRLDGLRAFDSAAFDEGLAPLGGISRYQGPTGTNGVIGEQGVDIARAARSQGYGAALDGVNVTADAPYIADTRATVAAGDALPDPMRGNMAYTLPTRVGQAFDNAGNLSGNAFQQAIRGLRRDAKGVEREPYGSDFGAVTRQAEGDLFGLLDRQAPGVVPDFNTANGVNRNVEILRTAVNSGRNGARTGIPGGFAPSQLADAAAANSKKFGGTHGTTDQPFFDLSRAGQEVLPSSVPDSGTTGRAALLALPTVLSAAGGAGGYAAGDTQTGSEVGLGTGALLSLLGSRGAQRGIVSLLADRPDVLRRLGTSIYDNAGYGALPATALTPMLTAR